MVKLQETNPSNVKVTVEDIEDRLKSAISLNEMWNNLLGRTIKYDPSHLRITDSTGKMSAWSVAIPIPEGSVKWMLPV